MIAAGATLLSCGLLATFCIHMLLDTKEILSEREGRTICSFSEIAYLSAGKRGKLMVDVACVSSQLGFCCVYYVFIGQNMALIYDFGFKDIYKAQVAWMMIAGIVFIPLVWVRKLAYFSITNGIALLVVMLSLLLMLGGDTYQIATVGIGPDINWTIGTQFLSFFGTCVYAFEGEELKALSKPNPNPNRKP